MSIIKSYLKQKARQERIVAALARKLNKAENNPKVSNVAYASLYGEYRSALHRLNEIDDRIVELRKGGR